jgi:hypothetical protein
VGIPELSTRQDAFTDPGACAGLYDDLPKSPAELRDLVSQLIVHIAWGGWYGVAPGASVSREKGDTRGLWFIRVDVTRDLMALMNRYTSAWDGWRNATAASKVIGPTDLAAVDAVAEIIGKFEAGQDSLALLETAASDNRLPPWPA